MIHLKNTRLVLLLAVMLLLAAISIRLPSARADTISGSADPVTLTKHVNLGFTSDVPFSGTKSDSFVFGAFKYNVMMSGTAHIVASMGADITLSYDPANLVGGGSLPVHITYTPTSLGSHVTVDTTGTATVDFSLCSDCPEHLPLTLAAGQGTFTAPMGADSPVTISGSSSTVSLGINFQNPIGFLDMADLSLSSALTLGPASMGTLPGLGGAAGILQAAGGTVTSPALGILEWDSSGTTLSGAVQLPVSPSGGVDLTLQPILHWLSTSGDVNLNIHLTGAFKTAVGVALGIICGPCALAVFAINDPSPISLFSGSLGTVYTSAGLDTQIGSAVGPPAGTFVTARVAAGFLPIPELNPELSSIPPVPKTLGNATFSIPGVAISNAPAGGVLAGSPVSLTAVVGRGTSPFTFSWTKNGAPLATTGQTLTDSATIGTSTYAATVTDSLGAVSNTDTVTVHSYDLTVSLTPASFTVPQGAPATYTVSVVLNPASSLIGVPASVSTSLLGLPSGALSPSFPTSLALGTSPSSATFTVNTATTTPTGTYTLTAKGSTNTGSRTGTATLVVITPQQAVQNLINSVNGMGLPMGTANSLIAPLKQAADLITAGNTAPVCNKLNAFIMTVNTYLASGQLTAAQANLLIQQANLIRASLNC